MTIQYKALLVDEKTHSQVKSLAAKAGLTIDEFIKSLIKNKKNEKTNS